jgi:GNAT superfamily N-acetyltransferase
MSGADLLVIQERMPPRACDIRLETTSNYGDKQSMHRQDGSQVPNSFTIRKAMPADAEEGCLLLRRSIIELCQLDHQNDPDVIHAWIANKTPENWMRWIASSADFIVSEEGKRLSGVSMMSGNGNILLNYVLPDSRFRGISKAMLAQLEASAAHKNLRAVQVTTTKTALRFYTALGYHPSKLRSSAETTLRKDFKVNGHDAHETASFTPGAAT